MGEIPELSFWQKLNLKVLGIAFVRWETHDGWRGYLPFYVVMCPKHGLYLDYPHGHREYFQCLDCLEERRVSISEHARAKSTTAS